MSEMQPGQVLDLFFCGIGGSGMLPLALLCKTQGHTVSGSDRACDQGKSPQKFRQLEKAGIGLFPQDGSGVSERTDRLIVSSAVEDRIPDIRKARETGVEIQKRAELLATLFNEAPTGVGIAGTSGKSTVTGMIASLLKYADKNPTVMNGGMIKNFSSAVRYGSRDIFVSEVDESDGSIALYKPAVAVLNNIALDHKPLEELQGLFKGFADRAGKAVILNADDKAVTALVGDLKVPVLTYSIEGKKANLQAEDIKPQTDGVEFAVSGHPVKLKVPGYHNVSNALAALCVGRALGIPLETSIRGLESFEGIKRRLETVGVSPSGITVIDDFAHNPDKIAASLRTLKTLPGRLFVFFQPHGYGPLRLMGEEIARSFIEHLDRQDMVCMSWPFYAGGTTEKDNTVQYVTDFILQKGLRAELVNSRGEFLDLVLKNAKSGDRIVIMGARDDTLSDFALEILKAL